MFDVVQKVVFKEMFYNTFQRFRDSPEYAKMQEDIKNAYNKVNIGIVERGKGAYLIETACSFRMPDISTYPGHIFHFAQQAVSTI